MQYLTAFVSQTMDEELKALVETIQVALFGGDMAQLGTNLNDASRQVWEAIVAGISEGGTAV